MFDRIRTAVLRLIQDVEPSHSLVNCSRCAYLRSRITELQIQIAEHRIREHDTPTPIRSQ
jgi:hypothetical protein